jgi:hypothetical protein
MEPDEEGIGGLEQYDDEQLLFDFPGGTADEAKDPLATENPTKTSATPAPATSAPATSAPATTRFEALLPSKKFLVGAVGTLIIGFVIVLVDFKRQSVKDQPPVSQSPLASDYSEKRDELKVEEKAKASKLPDGLETMVAVDINGVTHYISADQVIRNLSWDRMMLDAVISDPKTQPAKFLQSIGISSPPIDPRKDLAGAINQSLEQYGEAISVRDFDPLANTGLIANHETSDSLEKEEEVADEEEPVAEPLFDKSESDSQTSSQAPSSS